MYPTAEETIRHVESHVLDRHHRQFDLLSRNEDNAVDLLVKTLGRIMRRVRAGHFGNENESAKLETLNKGLRGLGHCLRWIRDRSPSAFIVPRPSAERGFAESFELLRWGAAYDRLWNQHSAWSSGRVSGEVDESAKRITFRPVDNPNPRFFCVQYELAKSTLRREQPFNVDERLMQNSDGWFQSFRPADGGFVIDDAAIRRCGAIDIVMEWLERVFLPYLPSTDSLVGCTVDDVRRVLASLYAWSFFLTRFEEYSDDHPELGANVEFHVNSRPRGNMVEWLANLSGVGRESVDSIVETLTFSPTDDHVTAAQQPFVSTRNGNVFLIPRIVKGLDLPRTYIGALSREEGATSVFNSVTTAIERAGVRAIASEIEQTRFLQFQIVNGRTFDVPDENPITPDMVILTDDNELLVIDVKFALPPFGPRQVHRLVDKMELEWMPRTSKREQGWKPKMRKYLDVFNRHPEILAQHFRRRGNERLTVFGLILLRWPLPIPVDFEGSLGAVDWPSLKEHLEHGRPGSVRRLVTWVHERPDVEVSRSLAWMPKDVEVGEWTYRYHVLETPTREQLLHLTQNLAYQRWESRGRPLWDDQRDWHDAEAHIAVCPPTIEAIAQNAKCPSDDLSGAGR